LFDRPTGVSGQPERVLPGELRQIRTGGCMKTKIEIKNYVLLSPGEWNGNYYSREELSKIKFPKNTPITIEFDESKIVGEATNFKVDKKTGNVSADAVIKVDDNLLKAGIAPRFCGNENQKGELEDIELIDLSIVNKPCYPNSLEVKDASKER